LSVWVTQTVADTLQRSDIIVKAFNFSAYGASFVHIDEQGQPVTPLYNYLKPFPAGVSEIFYRQYGGAGEISLTTASPVLGNLNSGMQLYLLQKSKPEFFGKIKYSLHLPQYISWLVTGIPFAEITSIGCHTLLWNYTTNNYHEWVYAENIAGKFPPLFPSDAAIDISVPGKKMQSGIGLHDSSSALVPYRTCFTEPFILISTGTWCISLNAFNDDPLTKEELAQDCLCYMGHDGHPVKASRLFAGYEHEQQVKRLAHHFLVANDYFQQVKFDPSLLAEQEDEVYLPAGDILEITPFARKSLNRFLSYEQAYHQLMQDIISCQKKATRLVFSKDKITRIFVDGGFAKNPVYMQLLAMAFPDLEVYAASVSQATAIGAALVIHKYWNTQPIPVDMVSLKYYANIQ
jgi:sugar (pentulose or hexulose) kinase